MVQKGTDMQDRLRVRYPAFLQRFDESARIADVADHEAMRQSRQRSRGGFQRALVEIRADQQQCIAIQSVAALCSRLDYVVEVTQQGRVAAPHVGDITGLRIE